MAFSMFLGETQEDIDHHEEYVLVMVASHPKRYPVLSSVWHRFDESPQITPDDANAIVHELIMLLAANHADRALTQLIVRLLPFFSQSYRTQEPILCSSD
jgi:uncharacterized protein YbgA (DUF1722 family)